LILIAKTRKTVQARVETARGAKGELRKLCVPARGKQDVEVYVPQAGDHLHWYFTASSDIDFGVARKDGAEAIFF
jgi:hypothetical protein